jgi:cell division protein FtsB
MKRARAAKRVTPVPGTDPAGKKAAGKKPSPVPAARKSAPTATKPSPAPARGKGAPAHRGRPAQPQRQSPRKAHPNPRRRITLSLLTLAALVIVGVVLAGPIMRNIDASRETRAKQAELEKEHAITEDLETRKAEANDIEFLEEEARRIGYVLPGEIPVVVVEEAIQEQEQAAALENGGTPAENTPAENGSDPTEAPSQP